MVAAAIVGAAVVGGVATSVAGSSAASATNNATNASVNEQNQALANQNALSAPYRGVGTDAISNYENLLGTGPNSNANTISEALQKTPGYQFTQQQGETGILNAASASGGLSGNTLTALDKYNTGLADQTYQQALGNNLNAVELGQSAAAGQAANIGNAANNISTSLTNQGTNIANIDMGEAAGISKAIGSGANNYAVYQALAA
jgi:hypothetical protein